MSGSLQDESVVVVWTQDFLSSPYLNELKMRGHEALSWLQSAPQLQTNSQNVLAAPDDLPKTMPPALPPPPSPSSRLSASLPLPFNFYSAAISYLDRDCCFLRAGAVLL